MKNLIIVVLLILVIGLYYVPDFTKHIMKTTASKAINLTKDEMNRLKEGTEANITNISTEIYDINKEINLSNLTSNISKNISIITNISNK